MMINYPLTHLDCLRISGQDRFSFLQNLISNDVNQLKQQTACWGAICNPKGRILCLAYMFQHDEHIVLMAPIEVLPDCLKRLNMYKIRAKVSIELNQQEYGLIGFSDESSPVTGLDLPSLKNQVSTNQQVSLIKVSDQDRYLLYGTQQDLAIYSKDNLSTEQGNWRLQDIQAGLSQIFAENVDQILPQNINLELTGAVSFTKGCFPGQEIIARMHYLGNPKKRMFRFSCQSSGSYAPGTAIYAQDKNIGMVIDAQPNGDCTEILASIPIKLLSAQLNIASPDGPELTKLSLPYDPEAVIKKGS